MAALDHILERLGRVIAERLDTPTTGYVPGAPSDPEALKQTLRAGDVLLVEGNQKLSSAIKYLTQSTWSHAALFVGDALGERTPEVCKTHVLIEANIAAGVVAVPLIKYASYNTRICRPIGLSKSDISSVIAFAISRLGSRYDTRNIVDLARYLLPTLPVPVRFRRKMIALGSGEPTRVICSTLIAQAFQSVRYPILPRIEHVPRHASANSDYSRDEILHIRHHSLFAPRDFDLSPYFQIVKPTLEAGFDHRQLKWADGGSVKAAGFDPPLDFSKLPLPTQCDNEP
jgi:hypothetical protein